MKTQTITTYSAGELKTQFPYAFARALDHWQNNVCQDIAWQDETIDSLKACVSAAGIKLRDWSLGAYNRGNFISIGFPQDEAEDLKGPRAMAWLENNLLSSLRIPWTGKGRTDVRKYGVYYRPGLIRPCPFTGYCADDEYLDSLRKAVNSGDTLKEAFESLADVCMRLLEADAEQQASEEYFLEHAEANDLQFTEDGEEF